MQYFGDEENWIKLLDLISPEYKNENKGRKFEGLVQKLLQKIYGEQLKFKSTKISHDGSKDFWAIDNNNELWWAECKNNKEKLGLEKISPTLFMAEIYEINYIIFFSYSKLNNNLLRKIGLYGNKHHKKTFVYDDCCIEFLILKYFNEYAKKVVEGFVSDVNNLAPESFVFSEKNPLLYNRNAYDGYYDIKILTEGEIYNKYYVVHNYSDETICVDSKLVCNNYYKIIGDSSHTVNVEPYELLLLSYSFVLVKPSIKKISLPTIRTTISYKNNIYIPFKSTSEKVLCESGHSNVLVGKHFETIIDRATKTLLKSGVSTFLIYGKSGTGKTRILHECYMKLSAYKYIVMNFTNFDSSNDWKNVIKEIIYDAFSIEDDVIVDILCNLSESGLSEEIEERYSDNKKIFMFINLLNKNDPDIDELKTYYPLLFEKMKLKRYALIIDNFQSYSPYLIEFFEEMIEYMLNCNRDSDIGLLFSINTDLIFYNHFSSFISKIINMKSDDVFSSFYCENIRGFLTNEQSMVYLCSILRLSEFPLYDRTERIIIKKGNMRPKYIEQIANYLTNSGCIEIKNNIGYVVNERKLLKCLGEVPEEYKYVFAYNYECLIRNHEKFRDDFKQIYAMIFIFGEITEKTVTIFNINLDALKILLKHGFLINVGSGVYYKYKAEHDLSMECIATYIYEDLLNIAAEKICSLNSEKIKRLCINDSTLALCKLVNGNYDVSYLKNIDFYEKIDKLPNRQKFEFAEYFLKGYTDNYYELQGIYVNCVNVVCKYVNDHINVMKAEILFETANLPISQITSFEYSVLNDLFSFYIHMAENKMHLEKSSDVMSIYDRLYKIMSTSTDILKNNEKIQYAIAYILNREFVCGKIEGDVQKRIIELEKSKMLCKKYGFWDILFENYFDEANLYKADKDSYLKCLQKGFDAFVKTDIFQKRKFMPNFLSKKLQSLCINKEFNKALCVSNKALEYLVDNNNVNYHLFFKKRFLRYKIISLISLNMMDDFPDTLHEFEMVDELSGNSDISEMIYYNALFSYLSNEKEYFEHYFSRLYEFASESSSYNFAINYILQDLAIKLRQSFCNKSSAIKLNDTKFKIVNEILTKSDLNFDSQIANLKSKALISDTSGNILFYIP